MPANDQDARIDRLEAKDRQLELEMKELEEHQSLIDNINKDNDAATKAIEASSYAALVQINNQTAILTAAMMQFENFVNLPPPKRTSLLAIAFDLVAAGLPILGLVKFFKTDEQLIQDALAVEASAALGNRYAQGVKLSKKLSELNENVIKKEKEAIEKLKKEAEKSAGGEEGAPKAKTEIPRGPMQQMMAANQRASELFSKALDVVHSSFARRITYPKVVQKESLLQLARRLMPAPPTLTDGERLQIQNEFLWQILGAWIKDGNVKKHEKWVIPMIQNGSTNRVGARYLASTEMVGINEAQLDKIVEFFGYATPRGTYFYRPMIQYGEVFVSLFGPLKVEPTTEYSTEFTRGAIS